MAEVNAAPDSDVAGRHRLEIIRDLRERVAYLERQRDTALVSRMAYEAALHDSDARLNALIKEVGWNIAKPVLDRVDKGLSDARQG